MAVAFDATSGSAALVSTATTVTWTHTPVGIPRGVIVLIPQGTSVDQITTVTYGGVALTRVRRAARSAAEACDVYVYFRGAGIPTGAQTVAVTSTGTAPKWPQVITVTAAADTVVDVEDGLDAGIIANPSLTLVPTAQAFLAYVNSSGLNAPVSTPETGTTQAAARDLGTISGHMGYKAVAGAGSTTIGWTSTSDDVCHAGLAIKEQTVLAAGANVSHHSVPVFGGSWRGVQARSMVVGGLFPAAAGTAQVGADTISLSETVTAKDTSAADTITVSEAVVARDLHVADTIGVSEAASVSVAQTAADTITISEAVSRKDSQASDTATITEQVTAKDTAAADTITVTETVTAKGSTSGDQVTVSEAVSARDLQVSDTIGISEAASVVASFAGADAITITEAVKARDLQVADTIGVSEAVSAKDSTAADTITLTEAGTRVDLGQEKTAADTITISEAVSARSIQVGDTIGVTEDIRDRALSQGDTIGVSEAVSGHDLKATDTITVTETGGVSVPAVGADTITVQESIPARSIQVADTIGVSEAVSGHDLKAVDSIGVSETASVGQFKNAADTITISETVASLDRPLTEIIAVVEAVSHRDIYVEDVIGVEDTISDFGGTPHFHPPARLRELQPVGASRATQPANDLRPLQPLANARPT